MKRYVSNGRKVIIEINRPQKQKRIIQPAPASGMIRARRPDDYLPRRKRPGGFIEFYDLGFLDGETIYKSWVRSYTLSPSAAVPFIIHEDVTEARLQELAGEVEDVIFGVPVGEWENRFGKITKGSIFERDIDAEFVDGGDTVSGNLSELEQWTDQGLQLTPENLDGLKLTFGQYNLGSSFQLDLSSNIIKITSEYNPNAPHLNDFEFSPSMKIFMLPELVERYGEAIYADGVATVGDVSIEIIKSEIIPAIHSLVQREDFPAIVTALDAPPPEMHYRLSQTIKHWPQTEFYRGTRTLSGGGTPVTNWTTMTASDYPNSTYFDTSGPISIDITHFGMLQFTSIVEYLFRRLVCVIKKDGALYYVWRISGVFDE